MTLRYGLACAEAMREECAKACDTIGENAGNNGNRQRDLACMDCAAAIRGIEVEHG